jgi:hypothetical protein
MASLAMAFFPKANSSVAANISHGTIARKVSTGVHSSSNDPSRLPSVARITNCGSWARS